MPAAGSRADCPKRAGHNKLLFGDDLGRHGDRCADPSCYQAKMIQLQVHEPEELIFVEQTPMTMGGPGDLTQTALPALEDSTTSELLGSMAGA